MNKLYAILFGFVSFIASIILANKSGKKKGKKEEISKQNELTLKAIKNAKKIQAKNANASKSNLIRGLSKKSK
jgi:hypothetical protein